MLSLAATLEVIAIVIAVNVLMVLAGLAAGRRMLQRTMQGMMMPSRPRASVAAPEKVV